MSLSTLSPIDAAWLHMEDATNLMVITGVLWFDSVLPLETLRAVVAERLVGCYPRFSQVIVEPPLGVGPPRWVPDPHFDLDVHLHRLALPAPGGHAELQALASDLMATPIDRAKALWDLYLVEGFGDGCALIARLHHSMADGISLARVLLTLTDEVAGIEGSTPRADRPHLFDLLAGQARSVIQATRRAASVAVAEGLDLLGHPQRLASWARTAAGGAAAFGRILSLPADPPSALKGDLVVAKRVAWSRPVPLETIKAIGRAVGGTVNDVLLSAMTGALRRYLEGRGTPVDEVRALVPVNMRPLDRPVPRELGNKVSLVFLPLPVGEPDSGARLAELKRRMDAIKASQDAAVGYLMLNAVGATPPRLERLLAEVFGAKASLVMTNVPGPRQPISLAGIEVAGVMFWVPMAARLGLGVSIFSYAGQVTVGLASDAGLVPDPQTLAEAFEVEIAALEGEA